MKRLGRIVLIAVFACTLVSFLKIADAQEPVTFKLSGVEVVKGIDIGDIRYGTKFTGAVFEGSDKLGYNDVGYWWVTICHTDTENIEVCGGTGNLLRANLVVIFLDGRLAGHRLYLGLKEPGIVEDVYWNAMAPMCGPAFEDPACACPNNPDDIESWNCHEHNTMPEGYGPVATIPELQLKRTFGTTLKISGASLSGYLCHNWFFVPRVLGYLTLY